ncbi:MAG: TonB-dependent receptor [Opitutaceae bacterium]|nr:TonB-dependent receptor [Opitutaceae bacterium]
MKTPPFARARNFDPPAPRTLLCVPRCFRPLVLGGGLILALLAPVAHAAEMGALTGTVSNRATGNLLEGAKIELPQLGVAGLTDATGRFVLPEVPAGTHEIVASYVGLDPIRTTVVIASGQRAVRDFDLTSDVYRLDAFKVTGEREGASAAITAERNADNVKSVVSMDQFGNLPNLNAAEVAARLPGVVGFLDVADTVNGFIVRGMDRNLNSVTMDGAMLTGQGAMNRTGIVNNITGTMFEQVELTKGHTPDKGANSLGGTVNFKSRSPLSMKEKRRINYSFSGRLAPSFTQQIPLREQHRFHPISNVNYQEVFNAFGGERNLGVAINLFSSETILGWFTTTRDFENTLNQPAFLWDYRTADAFDPRHQNSVNVKVDYRLSPATKLTFLGMAADHKETAKRTYLTRAFTNQVVGTSGTAGILPGYTNRITEIRAVPASTIDVTETGPNIFINRTRRVDVGAEHEFDRLNLDYNARHTQTHIHLGNSNEGGVLINRITNVGWILDRTESDMYPRFTQTAGPDFTNPANYRPAPNGLANNLADTDQDIDELTLNVRYTLPVAIKAFVKTGVNWRDQHVGEETFNRRWNYTGTTALPDDPSLLMFDQVKTGRRIPQWDAARFMFARTPVEPTLWREDVYFREQTKYTGTDAVQETITAGYIMVQGRVGRNGLLAGVRTEKTDTESWGWVRSRSTSTAAQQAADPVGAAERDYANNRRDTSGSYTKSFPSIHLTRDFTSNLRGRLSWSTSFGRPSLNNVRPNETVNENNHTLTLNNPSLLPQTAANWDATLDYYFEPVGNLSVGWFHKTIEDYIVSGVVWGTVGAGNDNGYNGQYEGLTLLRSDNAGTAIVQGWEFSYQQQFTFLPGFLRGLSAQANCSIIDTHGDFGGRLKLTTGQVAGFIPRSGNLSLWWRHRGFSARVLVNYASEYITNYSAASAGRNLYRFPRRATNVGLAYQFRPSLSLSCDVTNVTNEPQAFYRGIPDQLQSRILQGTSLTIGVSGRY